jgi:hypothetical protein
MKKEKSTELPIKKPRKKKAEEQAEPYWTAAVNATFAYWREKFDCPPAFDKQQPKCLKNILKFLRLRAEEKGVEWSEFILINRLTMFFDEAYRNEWLSKNFRLQNLDSQKDVIVINAIKRLNDKK